MSLSVQQFKSVMGSPAKVFNWNIFIADMPLAQFKAQTTQVPSVASSDMELWYQGEKVLYHGSVEYEHNWVCQVAESQDGIIYNSIYAWRQLVFSQTAGLSGTPLLYKRPVTIQLLNDQKIPYLGWVLKGCYPKQIDTIDLDRANNTEVLKWGITFNFDSWEKLI
jgi:hypothetical protein